MIGYDFIWFYMISCDLCFLMSYIYIYVFMVSLIHMNLYDSISLHMISYDVT